MIGSSSCDLPFVSPSRAPMEPATLKAISEESTSWYDPSTSLTRTSTTGNPPSTPVCSDSRTPCSTGLKYSFGTAPTDDLLLELDPRTGLVRLELEYHVPELPLAATLPDEASTPRVAREIVSL